MQIAHPCDVKTGPPDPVDFAKTWSLCRLQYAKNREKWITDLWQFAQKTSWQFAPLFVRPWHMAAASARYAKGLCAICQSRGPGEPVLLYCYECATVRTIALKLPIF
jgi:hypothetical protein